VPCTHFICPKPLTYRSFYFVSNLEVVLPDSTRCDCVTETHAVEFDFGSKWTEAVGQSIFYSLQAQKKAGIVLILETKKDRKYWIRMNTIIEHFNLPIDTWNVGNASY